MRTNPIHIACATDTAFLPHCAAMLHSVLALHPDTHVHFLRGTDVEDAALAQLAGMVARQGGRWHEHAIPPAWVDKLPRLTKIPALMWYRIYLPQLLPTQSRVLYLDADTLVTAKLDALWRTPLDGQYLAAVTNVLPPQADGWPTTLGLDSAQDYFNSGVLLLNLDALRADDMAARLAAFGRAPQRPLKWPDQDAFNALLWRKRAALHPRYNCQNSFYHWRQSRALFPAGEVEQALAKPAIVHFEGAHLAKPWHYLNRHPWRQFYFEQRAQTPWPTVKIEGRRRLSGLLRPLPTRWTIALLSIFYALRRRLR